MEEKKVSTLMVKFVDYVTSPRSLDKEIEHTTVKSSPSS